MRRVLSRVARMSAAEARWRATCAARTAAQRLRASLNPPQWHRADLARVLADTPELAAARRALRERRWDEAHQALSAAIATRPPRFVIAPSMREGTASRIAAAFPSAPADAVARADRIARGEYDLLGYDGLRFDAPEGVAPDWHLDPVHARRAPASFWATVPYLDPAYGDHKIIWELNRQQHLLALGRAYWLASDARYRDVALARIGSWLAANPPLTGINWASMLELGFRTLSWVWAIHFFTHADANDSEPWLLDVLLALDRQLAHVEQNLSYYFSPNTHLLGEGLALYVCGRALPLFRASERYAASGRQILVDQLTRQVGRDGGHLERSAHYHRYTLDFYILALAIARITADPVASVFESAVARLGFAARLLADDRGRLPHLGDDDGGMLFPMCGRAPDDIRDSLAEAGALVDRPDLRVSDAPEEAWWMLAHPLLAPALERARTVPPVDAIGSAALPDTGYYVSRSSAGDHLIVDAGRHGFENAGHAHADALSVTLTVRGVPLLIDPGTGSYTADPEARDRFRSSLLHNTLVVDGRSQSLPSGPFHWEHAADATAHVWRTNPGFDFLEASHDGYAPLSHRRHVLAVHGDVVIVADLVEGTGSHAVQVHWHLDPQWSVQVAGRQAILRGAGERVELAISHGSLERVMGADAEPVGWHSPVYGRIEQTTTLRVSASGPTPLWLVSVFGMNPSNEVISVEQIPVWAQAGALERALAVRIARAHSVDVFGLAAPSGHADRTTPPLRETWRLAGYETDARMLFCRASDTVSRLAMVDGSLVRSTDRQALYVHLPREAPDLHLDFPHPRGDAPAAARVSGPAFGAHVQFGGRDLPVAVERRSTARATARRPLRSHVTGQ
jgi:hypothetical protein